MESRFEFELNLSAGYGYSRAEAPPLYACTCVLRGGAA